MKKITYNKQYLDNKDIKEVIKSLKSLSVPAGDNIITMPREIGNLRKNRVTYYGGAKTETAVPRVEAGIASHFTLFSPL